MATFKDFNENLTPKSGDFLVGYDESGVAEFKVNIGKINELCAAGGAGGLTATRTFVDINRFLNTINITNGLITSWIQETTWALLNGTWNDGGTWDDTSIWNDG